MAEFKLNRIQRKIFKQLDKFVPVVARVHGDTHPEFLDVQKVYNDIVNKIENKASKEDLQVDFTKLKDITNNFTIPDDVCETYEAVYKMLNELSN